MVLYPEINQKMNRALKQIFSFILPVIVLIIVPLCIEKDIVIKLLPALLIGVIIMVIGLYAITMTVSSIIKIGKGTLAPWSPSRHLVIGGMYGYIRNPMILGVLTVLIGESIVILSYKILIWAVCFFVINNIWFIIYEEPNLENKFGDEYREYKRNVPRWVPRLKSFKPDSDFK
jgi:protein-S-isoprenylcysteine O-methyltransferase Ste14